MSKVMLIDDDESMRLLIGQLVEREGHEFCCASNGVDGLEMLRRERPDLLILDVMLPDINGFELCQTIRSEGRRVPIMFLTAKGDIVDKSIGFKAGADDYLVKPFHNEELVLRMNARLRRRGDFGPKSARTAASYRVGDLEIFFGKYDVRPRAPLSPRSRSSCSSCSRPTQAASSRATRSWSTSGATRTAPTPAASRSLPARSARRSRTTPPSLATSLPSGA